MKIKLLAMLVLAISFNTFGQVGDGYHEEPKITCMTGECLHVGKNHPIEMITKTDIDGYEYRELNTDSSILDVIGPNVLEYACFSGKKMKNLQEIIDALVGNTNRYYTQGGHSMIESHHGYTTYDGYKVVLKVRSDYRPYEYVYSPEIKFCP